MARSTSRPTRAAIGRISFNLKGLRRNALYSIRIRGGTCADPGTVGSKIIYLRTTATGTVLTSLPLLPWEMQSIWAQARKSNFIVRMASGTNIRCGQFRFAKATRVVISTLNISLPVIRGSNSYPKCRVAMYSPAVAQPREPGYTFIYAHARRGMFLPLLTKFKASGAAGLIGRVVKVYTSDNYVSYYKIVSAKQTQDSFGGGLHARSRTSPAPDIDRAELHVPEAHRRCGALQDAQEHEGRLAADAASGQLLAAWLSRR